MKLGTRIFFCNLVIFAVCFYYPIDWILDNLRIRYLEGVEDPLVDQANILASIVGLEMETGTFNPEKLSRAFEKAYARRLSAQIYTFLKTNVDIQAYMTDADGKVFFDTAGRDNLGEDYSRWRDVRLTLNGFYGARTSLKDVTDPTSSVLYVAAPILVYDRIAGVLTIAKPTTNINNFIKNATPRIFGIGIVSLLAAIFLSYLVSILITRPIKRLTQYANDVGAGKRTAFPKLGSSEAGELGQAFINMQSALEGKKYVEQYIQNLTHEIKGPLSGIRGAAELLEEDMAPDSRSRFLTNIRSETNRIQGIIDQMLELSVLENLKALQKTEIHSVQSLVQAVLEQKKAILSMKKIDFHVHLTEGLQVTGDPFLLQQAISNLVQNAIDFSTENNMIRINTKIEGDNVILEVIDNGTGIPEYAGEKIFDKFFSLQRPDTGRKSTGLGLNFVRQVVLLHGGDVVLKNRSQGGTVATLMLPLTENKSEEEN